MRLFDQTEEQRLVPYLGSAVFIWNAELDERFGSQVEYEKIVISARSYISTNALRRPFQTIQLCIPTFPPIHAFLDHQVLLSHPQQFSIMVFVFECITICVRVLHERNGFCRLMAICLAIEYFLRIADGMQVKIYLWTIMHIIDPYYYAWLWHFYLPCEPLVGENFTILHSVGFCEWQSRIF